MPIKELGGRVIGREPISMQQKIMNLVRKDNLFELDILLPQSADEIYHLIECDISIIVALDKQNG